MQKKSKFRCTVPKCDSDRIFSSKRKLQYCIYHHNLALDLYNQYKLATKIALETFDKADIEKAIMLRKKYDFDFVGQDIGAHVAFIEILQCLLKVHSSLRKEEYERQLHIFKEKYGER